MSRKKIPAKAPKVKGSMLQVVWCAVQVENQVKDLVLK